MLPQIIPLELAAQIIRKADREHPADTVLREELRASGNVYRSQSTEVSHAVFAYYRWFGWLDPHHPLTGQIKRALELAEDFTVRPETFSDATLVQRGLPSWVASHMDCPADWVRTLQTEPSLWIRVRHGLMAQLRRNLERTAKSPLPNALRYVGREDLFRTPEFQDGQFEIQDIASQIVGLLCDPKPGETWWDACAGEGGKTLHLSDLMQNKGLIWASDRADWRLKKLKLRAGRAHAYNYRTVPWQGGPKPPTKTKFDGILVDAPCAGTGTWQRNPHARWTTSPQDVRELSEIQKNLLRHAAGSLKPGGKLIYSVCSLTRAETVEVTAAINQELPDLEPLPLPDLVQPGGPASPERWIWPQDLGGNGMFVAAWRRKQPVVPAVETSNEELKS